MDKRARCMVPVSPPVASDSGGQDVLLHQQSLLRIDLVNKSPSLAVSRRKHRTCTLGKDEVYSLQL